MLLHYQTSILKNIARVALHQRQTLCEDVLDVSCFTTVMRYVAWQTPFDSLLTWFKEMSICGLDVSSAWVYRYSKMGCGKAFWFLILPRWRHKMLGSNIMEKTKAWKWKRLGASAHLLPWIGLNNITRQEKSMACNLVCSLRSTLRSRSEKILIDRTSLSQDPNTHESQLYAQLAHSIVNFLGLKSPQELAEFGLNGVSDLVDLISRVCSTFREHYSATYGYYPVHDQHIYCLHIVPGSFGFVCITYGCINKSLLRSQRCGGFPSSNGNREQRWTPHASNSTEEDQCRRWGAQALPLRSLF
jgi:hypothetical protein